MLRLYERYKKGRQRCVFSVLIGKTVIALITSAAQCESLDFACLAP
jgi:hypothetical protein